MAKEKWIKEAIKHKGALGKTLRVKEGETIPLSKLKTAEHSRNPKTQKRPTLTEMLLKIRK